MSHVTARARRAGSLSASLALVVILAAQLLRAGDWHCAYLPRENLFAPLLADPEEHRISFGLAWLDGGMDASRAGTAGVGYSLGLLRFTGSRPGDSVQLGVSGAIQSLFDLGAPSNELVDVDYAVAAVLASRRGAGSLRLRIAHRSSHLGDEILIAGHAPERLNLSTGTVETVVARELDAWRLYAGGAWAFASDPDDARRGSALAGLELAAAPLGRCARIVAGLHLAALQERGWDPAATVVAGVSLSPDIADPGATRIQVLVEGHSGYAPWGQFFTEDADWYGLRLLVEP